MLRDPVADWRELSALYERAELLQGRELQAFLDGLGAESRHLAGDLERMLRAKAQAATEGFLETLPGLQGTAEPAPAEWGEGSRVGAYRLVQHIGSGGMAEVWLADRVDGAFERKVAIKLLFNHPSRAQRETFAERFRRERDILASLSHPNIAALHDAGVTKEGQPWLALEYVEGLPITEWCDEKRLTVEQRVVLFKQVLRAVEVAHAALVIHRDLKPSNILVNHEGEVKLLDFGIAKLLDLDDSELTRSGGAPLTLQYASPEQLNGRPLTTASDEFSLGLLLFELLSGSRPYEVRSLSQAELEREMTRCLPGRLRSVNVAEEGASRRGMSPQGLARLLRGDLDLVVAKALRPNPLERYPSIEALRHDLARWAGSRPVQARAAGAWYPVAKFWARHRLGVSAGVLALVLVVGAAAVATMQGVRATRESARASAARDFVIDVFREVDPERAGSQGVSATQVLRAGRAKALAELSAQPELQAEVLHEIGKMQQNIGDHRSADSTFHDIIAIRAGQPPSLGLAAARVEAAYNAHQLGDPSRAAQLIAQAAPDVPPGDAGSALTPRFLFVRALVAYALGDLAAASKDLRAALPLAEARHGGAHAACIVILRRLAQVESESGRYGEADRHIRDAMARAERANLTSRERFDLRWEHVHLDYSAGRLTGHRKLEEMANECDRAFGPTMESCLLLTQLRVSLLLGVGDGRSAGALVQRLLAAAGNDASPRRQISTLEFAVRASSADPEAHSRTERLRQALEFEERLETMVNDDALSEEDRAYGRLALAEAALRRGEFAVTSAHVERALTLQRGVGHSLPRLVARSQLLGGLALAGQGEDQRALTKLREATATIAGVVGASHPLTHIYRLNQTYVLLRVAGRSDTLDLIDSALPTLVQAYGQEAPVVGRAQHLRELVARGGLQLGSLTDFLT